jgi:hypothetical protein
VFADGDMHIEGEGFVAWNFRKLAGMGCGVYGLGKKVRGEIAGIAQHRLIVSGEDFG